MKSLTARIHCDISLAIGRNEQCSAAVVSTSGYVVVVVAGGSALAAVVPVADLVTGGEQTQ